MTAAKKKTEGGRIVGWWGKTKGFYYLYRVQSLIKCINREMCEGTRKTSMVMESVNLVKISKLWEHCLMR